MTLTPNFDELVGTDLPAEERERLRRVHDLLVAAGPPAEVPPSLADPPTPGAAVLPMRVPPRRRAALLIAAAVAAAAFGAGYLLGDRGGAADESTFAASKVVQLRGAGTDAHALVSVGDRDESGDWQMLVTVEGLPRLGGGDYYTLFMTEDGKPVAQCGTFNVRGGVKSTTIRLSVAYDPAEFDGFALAKYTHHDHKDRVFMSGRLS